MQWLHILGQLAQDVDPTAQTWPCSELLMLVLGPYSGKHNVAGSLPGRP